MKSWISKVRRTKRSKGPRRYLFTIRFDGPAEVSELAGGSRAMTSAVFMENYKKMREIKLIRENLLYKLAALNRRGHL